jgi:hypothetical protein
MVNLGVGCDAMVRIATNFKTVCGAVLPSWVGSIPMSLRQSFAGILDVRLSRLLARFHRRRLLWDPSGTYRWRCAYLGGASLVFRSLLAVSRRFRTATEPSEADHLPASLLGDEARFPIGPGDFFRYNGGR